MRSAGLVGFGGRDRLGRLVIHQLRSLRPDVHPVGPKGQRLLDTTDRGRTFDLGCERARQGAVTPPLQLFRHLEELPCPSLQQRCHADGGQALSRCDALRFAPEQRLEALGGWPRHLDRVAGDGLFEVSGRVFESIEDDLLEHAVDHLADQRAVDPRQAEVGVREREDPQPLLNE